MNYANLVVICVVLAMGACTRSDRDKAEPPPTQAPKAPQEKTQKTQKPDPLEDKGAPTAESKPLPPSETPKGNAVVIVPIGRLAGGGPALASTKKARAAKRALEFLHTQWKGAVSKGDAKAYEKLLGPDFKASTIAAKASYYERDQWLKLVEKRWTGPNAIKLGPANTHVVLGPATRVTVTVPERIEVGGNCRIQTREFTLHLWEDKEPLINNELEQNAAPCPKGDTVDVAVLHLKLKTLVMTYGALDEHLFEGHFWMRDYGITVKTYAGGIFQTEEGAWLRKALLASDADFDSTRYFGKMGTVRVAEGTHFVYQLRGESWFFAGVTRGQ